jgi:IS605 OrfB family transposase
MQGTEAVVVKVLPPTQRKQQWLDAIAGQFAQAVSFGLAQAQTLGVASRARLHTAVYPEARRLGLPADYARMAVNETTSSVRSFLALRRSGRKASFPTVRRTNRIGLGVNAYAIVESGGRFVLRVSTGVRGQYLWLPLSVPARYTQAMGHVRGDARLIRRSDGWYAVFPVHSATAPTACGGHPTVIGVDLGIVRLATAATPNGVRVWPGKAVRAGREHFADLRRRYGRHHRVDRIRAMRGKESRWMADLNHKISAELVEIASHHPDPVIALERLDGIRYRLHGSRRFNRMVSSWTFRDLVDKIQYKAERAGVRVLFVDPRRTSRTCPKCGHATRANRPTQADFRCVACGYRGMADAVAALNIAAAAVDLLQQGPSDTARPDEGQTESPALRPMEPRRPASLDADSNLASPSQGTPAV